MTACSIKVRGVVQGVGFRPFVFRLARANTLAGWVRNGQDGVEIFLEGADQNVNAFTQQLRDSPPATARITAIEIENARASGLSEFTVRDSSGGERISTRISPDLPICSECLDELFDPANPRHHYPYINCTNCGPRFSVALRLPYDRENTTMRDWRLDDFCSRQYGDPLDRRFHAQPVACASCGPGYHLQSASELVHDSAKSIRRAAELLREGKVVAIKGIGGYHLACDARNAAAIRALRERKYRKEKPFALMAKNLDAARRIVALSRSAEELLTSVARPIVLAPAIADLPEVAPESHELGVMLPYAPLHHLLFEAGALELLVMTSANRSSEPIAYEDSDALDRLSSIAEAFLIGERPIARRVEDSVARAGAFGPAILRRSRGYAPGAVATIPADRPILALGADLKNSITLVVEGQAFVSQHIGDLIDYRSLRAFRETIDDFLSMYSIDSKDLVLVHDRHPQYVSTMHAEEIGASELVSAQHHRAHIASVLAERHEWTKQVVGVSFDGTGYGDDATIWGGEIFAGSVKSGFERVAHLRRAVLPGGDAAAKYPVQAATGFLTQLEDVPNFTSPPFCFPERFQEAQALIRKGVRTFTTTSVGRLFDAAAALLGFTREVSYEGQAAMWLEQLARNSTTEDAYAFPFDGRELDFRPLLRNVASDRLKNRPLAEIARAFQRGLAQGLATVIVELCNSRQIDTAVLSGGVFQNELLLEDIRSIFQSMPIAIWTNHEVPANDGGISLGQASLAAFGQCRPSAFVDAHA